MEEEVIFFKGKKIGIIKNGCYTSFRNDLHLFRKYNGWGASIKLLDYLYQKKIEYFVINYKNDVVYYCYLDKFLTDGIKWDDDGDKQLILSLDKWEIYDEIMQTKII